MGSNRVLEARIEEIQCQHDEAQQQDAVWSVVAGNGICEGDNGKTAGKNKHG